MPLSHPRRSALSEQVIAALRAQITSGEWPVGSRIPTEPELVEQLGVARNTVREAVRALAHNGLLDIRQGSGTYVVATSELAGVMHRRFADAEPRHVAELRGALESSAARLAARAPHGAGPQQLDALLRPARAGLGVGRRGGLRGGGRDLPPGRRGRLAQRGDDRAVRGPGRGPAGLAAGRLGRGAAPRDATWTTPGWWTRSARATRRRPPTEAAALPAAVPPGGTQRRFRWASLWWLTHTDRISFQQRSPSWTVGGGPPAGGSLSTSGSHQRPHSMCSRT